MKECYGTHGVDHFEECKEIREKYMQAANVRFTESRNPVYYAYA